MIRGIRHLLLITMMCWTWPGSCALARDALPEYTIKAGYLYNFALLTEWPPSSIGKAFNICLYRSGIFATALESIQGKRIKKRPITIRYIERPAEMQTCHLLFVAEISRTEMNRVVKEIAAKPILTVTDDKLLEQEGVMVLLRPEGNRLVFELDQAMAERANLKFSSRLLRLAR
jgi:hypothetical protein